MESLFIVLGITLVLMGLAFAGIAIKILVKKGGQFSGTCASQNPMLNKDGEACSFCGAMPSQQCKADEQDNKTFSSSPA